MKKIFYVAWREFTTTVVTKGFILGVLITPTLLAIMAVVMPMLMNEQAPRVEGQIAVIDPTGEVAEGLRAYLLPRAIAERREESSNRVAAVASEQVPTMPGSDAMAKQALDALLGVVPLLEIDSLAGGSDVEREKETLTVEGEANQRLALAVIHEDAVERAEGSDKFGSYDLFVRGKLDDRIEDEIKSGLREAIVSARVRSAGMDRERIEALTRVAWRPSTTVTEAGEQQTNEVLNMLLPGGFMILLLASVMTGGQYLMTTTIEEKSSRVIEVLLSAVSPMQLMTGKILGQLCVGFIIMALYAGLGIAALVSFALMGLVDPSLFLYLIIFFLIAYFVVASMMAAIGSAVNEPREAQTLMMPVMLTIMIPWILWLPITRNPDSVFSTIISFIPPVNSFAMLLRMTSTSPPPLWQVWLSILIGIASAYGALWFAAKVFRVGLLMFGKPPNFATLIRWMRMA